MDLFRWEDRMLTGVSQIDEHHRHLVGLLNTTYTHFLNHTPPDRLGNLLLDLIDYATYHFSAEERIMVENSYPEQDRHLRQHVHFTQRVAEMHRDHVSNHKVYYLEILQYLKEWLESHILKSDHQMSRWLSQNNKQPSEQ